MPLFPQRNPSTGSRLYTNADLRDRQPLGVTLDEPNVPVANPPQHQPGDRSIAALLAEAKRTIGSSGEMLDGINSYDSAAEDEALAESEDAGTVTDGSNTHRLRDFTQMLAKPAPALATAGLVGAFTPAAPLAAGMMGAADVLAAPDMLRRLIAPGRHESRGGAALEAGAYAFGPAMKGLKALGKSDTTARFARMMDEASEAKSASQAETVRATVNDARDYRHAGASTEQASQRAGWPLGKSSQTGVVNHSGPGYAPDPISSLMDGQAGAFRRNRPMDALRDVASPSESRTPFGPKVRPESVPSVHADSLDALNEPFNRFDRIRRMYDEAPAAIRNGAADDLSEPFDFSDIPDSPDVRAMRMIGRTRYAR